MISRAAPGALAGLSQTYVVNDLALKDEACNYTQPHPLGGFGFNMRYDRPVDRRPAQGGHAVLGKVFPSYVPGGVEIRVERKAAIAADEKALVLAVGSCCKPTLRATLAGLSRIDGLDAATCRRCLIFEKGFELLVAPPMVPAPLALATLFGGGADALEVFKHDHGPLAGHVHDSFGKNMVAIAPEPLLPMPDAPKMAPGGGSAFGLKIAFEPEIPFFDFLPACFAQENISGRDRWTIDAEIHADSRSRRGKGLVGQSQDAVQPPCTVPVKKVGGVELDGLGQDGLGMRVRRPCNLDASNRGRKTRLARKHLMRTSVIADAPRFCARTVDLAALGSQRESGGDSLGGLDPGRTDKLRRQARVFLPKLIVGGFVKRHTVLYSLLPSVSRDSIKTVANHGQGLAKSLGLVGSGVEFETDSALHGSYMH